MDQKKSSNYYEQDAVSVVQAVGTSAPVPEGHSRFYCEKCRLVSP
jgi:hypothetical protein